MAEVDGESVSTLLGYLHRYLVPIILGCLSLLCIALSITIFIKTYQQTAPITFSSDENEASVSGAPVALILVDVEGAVVKPGVYSLPAGSRVEDAIAAAGGFAKDADRESVSRSVNRAAKLTDGAKLYMPFMGGRDTEESWVDEPGVPGTVNINSARDDELDRLPGVGAVIAGKIISGRPYLRIEELVEKKVMSQSLFEKLKERLTL